MQRGYLLLSPGWWEVVASPPPPAPASPPATPPTSFDALRLRTCEQRKLLVPNSSQGKAAVNKVSALYCAGARYLQNNVKVHSLLGWEWEQAAPPHCLQGVGHQEPPPLMSLPFAQALTWGGLLATWALLSPC